jgi:hypothetical protein
MQLPYGRSRRPSRFSTRGTLASRYGGWFAPLALEPGNNTRDGTDVLLLAGTGATSVSS